jgi:hypothetical protein
MIRCSVSEKGILGNYADASSARTLLNERRRVEQQNLSVGHWPIRRIDHPASQVAVGRTVRSTGHGEVHPLRRTGGRCSFWEKGTRMRSSNSTRPSSAGYSRARKASSNAFGSLRIGFNRKPGFGNVTAQGPDQGNAEPDIVCKLCQKPATSLTERGTIRRWG